MAEQWYCASQGRQVGPMGDAQLRQLVASQTLRPTDLVWQPGFANWVPAGSVPGLFPVYPAPPAAAAPASPGGYQPQTGIPYAAPAAAAYPVAQDPQFQGYPESEPYADDYPEPRRRKRKKRKKKGAPVGLIIGLVGGGAFIGLVVIGLIILIATTSRNPLQGGGSGAPSGPLAGSTYSGSETLQGYGKLSFQFGAGGGVTMLDNDGATPGNWSQSGSQVTLTFHGGNVTYSGTIDGNSLHGTGHNGKQTWTFKLYRQN